MIKETREGQCGQRACGEGTLVGIGGQRRQAIHGPSYAIVKDLGIILGKCMIKFLFLRSLWLLFGK